MHGVVPDVEQAERALCPDRNKHFGGVRAGGHVVDFPVVCNKLCLDRAGLQALLLRDGYLDVPYGAGGVVGRGDKVSRVDHAPIKRRNRSRRVRLRRRSGACQRAGELCHPLKLPLVVSSTPQLEPVSGHAEILAPADPCRRPHHLGGDHFDWQIAVSELLEGGGLVGRREGQDFDLEMVVVHAGGPTVLAAGVLGGAEMEGTLNEAIASVQKCSEEGDQSRA